MAKISKSLLDRIINGDLASRGSKYFSVDDFMKQDVSGNNRLSNVTGKLPFSEKNFDEVLGTKAESIRENPLEYLNSNDPDIAEYAKCLALGDNCIDQFNKYAKIYPTGKMKYNLSTPENRKYSWKENNNEVDGKHINKNGDNPFIANRTTKTGMLTEKGANLWENGLAVPRDFVKYQGLDGYPRLNTKEGRKPWLTSDYESSNKENHATWVNKMRSWDKQPNEDKLQPYSTSWKETYSDDYVPGNDTELMHKLKVKADDMRSEAVTDKYQKIANERKAKAMELENKRAELLRQIRELESQKNDLTGWDARKALENEAESEAMKAWKYPNLFGHKGIKTY